ncbi:fumarylacetoacetate hydrolase family protein [Aquimarina macrocephali]|uniref:fumarylacetoacetate hydrolase family protein n=1 Tax=Aquimarina macrocephali TaxID=666563 RepID=UPI000463397A|nr:fumarylacetoacetate hydrolase family protein [Aquimarina macrocephali]
MKHVRFAYNGGIHQGIYENDVILKGTQEFNPDDVMFLPPLDPQGVGKAIGVALAYADHAKELKLEIPEYPILFHKMPHTMIGHKSNIIVPSGIDYMHYECELVAVIGRSCRKVKAADALDYVGYYMVGNEITVRDFVVNYYRPPLKAKGFDTWGPCGPWMVDAKDIDPNNVSLKTWVNGELRQEGNTKNIRHNIAELIEYMSDFMTLNPGDMIWSGTPEGVSHIYPGDTVVCEVSGIGKLENYLIAE